MLKQLTNVAGWVQTRTRRSSLRRSSGWSSARTSPSRWGISAGLPSAWPGSPTSRHPDGHSRPPFDAETQER